MTEYFTRKICVSIKFQLGGLDIKSNLLKIKGAVESIQLRLPLSKSFKVTLLIGWFHLTACVNSFVFFFTERFNETQRQE